jgi:hypothetical protein
MSTPTLSAQQLELRAAEKRLEAANDAIRGFTFSNCFLSDGKIVFVGKPEERVRLEKEMHLLEVERDEAYRIFQKALKDWADTQ